MKFGEHKTLEDVTKTIKNEKIDFVRLGFTDILGQVKVVEATIEQFKKAVNEGQSIDGSSVEGYARIEESDLMIRPDLNTFVTLPWLVDETNVGFVFCDVVTADDEPYPGDPRGALKRAIAKLPEGTTALFGPEIEFFFFRPNGTPEVLDFVGYFDSTLGDLGTRARNRAMKALKQMGIVIETAHHEVAHSQHEIDPVYGEALTIADSILLTKMAIKEAAMELGIIASFMPKPIAGINGNGMHVHQSLRDEEKGKNLFHDADDPFRLSMMAQQYVGGILHHVRSMCLVTNQWLNSYKRLVPGFEAPTYMCCGRRNRSSLVRIPLSKSAAGTRIELRNPDPACNPYLALAVMLAAGLDGIKHKMDMPTPVEQDIFHLSEAEKAALGIQMLPHTLEAAIAAFRESTLMREVLGPHIFDHLIANKELELQSLLTTVTDFEIKKYLSL